MFCNREFFCTPLFPFKRCVPVSIFPSKTLLIYYKALHGSLNNLFITCVLRYLRFAIEWVLLYY